jgi:cholesterol oxidase
MSMRGRYDAVIVGSGFGGGVSACRLSEAGWRVCVLERGRRFAPEDFPGSPEQAPSMLWHELLNPGGMFDLRLFKDLAVLSAAGVGGGSLVYANVQLRAEPEVFAEGWPAGIDRAALDPFYDLVEEALEPRTIPPDWPRDPRDPRDPSSEPPLAKTRAFAAAARAAGREVTPLPLAVYFGEEPRSNPFGGPDAPRQQGCTNLARCNIGCPRGAKNTIDLTYLARAESHGAEVHALHEALKLHPPERAGGHWRVSFRNLDSRARGEVRAPVVVLAAGTLGSTRLLLKNRRRLGGLSPALGSRFCGDGDALGAAFGPRSEAVKGAHTEWGPVMTSRIDYWREARFMMADGGLPPGFAGLLEIARAENALIGWQRQVLLRLKSIAVALGLSDRGVTPRAVKLRGERARAGAEDDSITDALVFLMIGGEAAAGRMRLTWLLRCLDIEWSREASGPLFDAMAKATEAIAAGAQAKPFFELNAGPLGKYITVHPLGGCPMADEEARGVVDGYGRVYGQPGLVVADGAIVPTALGVNPSKTIAALAERCVAKLVEEGRPPPARAR